MATKLIKASTALKRAEAVDIEGMVLGNIADQIAMAAARGRTETYVYLPEAHEDFLTSKLLDAGYVLEFSSYDRIVDYIEDTRGRIRRFVDKVLGRDTAFGPIFESTPNRGEVTISWAPLPEAVEDEEFAEAA